ncbi:MAG: NADP-dependent oxidoreductase [Kibdelosporangium sp.]
MRAIQVDEHGGPEVLRLVDVPRPEPVPTEVLVRVHASGINPADWKTRSGRGLPRELPYIPGWDVSGVVAEVGYGVTRFAPGDEVFGMLWFPRPGRAYAEYVTAPSRQFAHKPLSLSHSEAAGLPLVGLTAWQALVTIANVQPGQRVFVQAAAGGVGHVAVQIAKARGAYVLGTASAAKHDLLRSLGVDEPIDYTATDFAAGIEPVDVLFDLLSAERHAGLVRPGGHLIGDPAGLAVRTDVHVSGVLVEPDRADLESLAALVDDGRLRVLIDREFDAADAPKAEALGEAGRTSGKLVLRWS